MRVSPLDEKGKRFEVMLTTKNGEAERFALGLGWVRRKVLLYAADKVDHTVTTRLRVGLEKVADRLEELTIPKDACDSEGALREKRLEELGITPQTSIALGEMAIQLRRDINPELNQNPAVESPEVSEVQPAPLLSDLIENYFQQF